MSSTVDHAAPTQCENCGSELHGHYCHECGQSVVNPIRHASHALEEVFESFWHLDGRVFRTLRDLVVPARLACNYIAGHRARYITPLRLFVILSVLTFFVGQMTVDFNNATVELDDRNSIASARTVAEVEARRDKALEGIAKGRTDAEGVPLVKEALAAAEAEVRDDASKRIAELQSVAPRKPPSAEAASGNPHTDARAAADATPVASEGDDDEIPTLTLGRNGPWDAKTNPVTIGWLPAFANHWLNAKIGRALENAPRLQHDTELRKRVLLGNVPTALFVLMPIFAVLLKLFYIGKRRLYLEHLVVALYSHAFLLLALLTIFVLVGLERVAPAGARGVLDWVEMAVWAWMPIYLLLMQKRVYGQGWVVTLLKYFALGTAYMMLVGFGAGIAFLAGLTKL